MSQLLHAVLSRSGAVMSCMLDYAGRANKYCNLPVSEQLKMSCMPLELDQVNYWWAFALLWATSDVRWVCRPGRVAASLLLGFRWSGAFCLVSSAGARSRRKIKLLDMAIQFWEDTSLGRWES